MEWMLGIMRRRGEAPRENVGMEEMMKYSAELSRQGRNKSGAPLLPEEQGVRLRVRRGKTELVDGPFAESKEVIGGYIMIEAASRAEALEWAKRCPHVRAGLVQLAQADVDRADATPGAGTQYLLVFLEGPDFGGDPDGAKYRAMEAWTDGLKRAKQYVECAGLAKSPPTASIESRGGKISVSDGPFAESKEVIGGFTRVIAPDRAAALEIAARCPHAAWGSIEVRELLKLPGR